MDEEFTIQELCDRTGFPRRTIHFYTQQGIIPPPVGSGLGARYQSEHLLKLKLIPVFRKQGLRLDDIRQKFQDSDAVKLAETFRQYQSESTKTRPTSPAPQPAHMTAQTYTVYTLPHDMILMVPEKANGALKSQVEKILQAFQIEKS